MAIGLFETNASLRNLQGRAKAAMGRGKQQAAVSKQALAVAAAANSRPDFQSQTQAAVAARDAYQASIGAEAEKHRATFLLLAAGARRTSANNMLAAQSVASARERKVTIERAINDGKRADILEEAAEQAYTAAKDVPEPEVVSYRRAQRLATSLGINLSSDPAAKDVSVSSMMPMNQKMVNPLASWIYPAGVKQASASLAGLGDDIGGPTFMDSVKEAIGAGTAAAGGAALSAGQRTSQGNPAAGVAISTAGGLLNAVAVALGLKSQQDEKIQTEQSRFPWGAVLTVAVVGGVGVLAWRAFK